MRLRTGLIGALAFGMLVTAGLLGERAGWFAGREEIAGVVRLRFSLLDARSGKPVAGVRAVCTRKGVRSACTQRPDTPAGVAELRTGVITVTERRGLRAPSRRLSLGADDRLYVMFIHPDYERRTLTLDAAALAAVVRDGREVRLTAAVGVAE
ncbi:MAG: hypothetical protein IT495_15225 [Gammaproteobacteria bacterium]|nr:hypothetical protein [Gammaproteobacteria bacterium]